MLGGLGLLLMQRLPQDLVAGGDAALGLGQLQLVWLLIAVGDRPTLATVVRSDAWLRLYKYTWAAAGIALLLLVFVLGSRGQRGRLSLASGRVAASRPSC